MWHVYTVADRGVVCGGQTGYAQLLSSSETGRLLRWFVSSNGHEHPPGVAIGGLVLYFCCFASPVGIHWGRIGSASVKHAFRLTWPLSNQGAAHISKLGSVDGGWRLSSECGSNARRKRAHRPIPRSRCQALFDGGSKGFPASGFLLARKRRKRPLRGRLARFSLLSRKTRGQCGRGQQGAPDHQSEGVVGALWVIILSHHRQGEWPAWRLWLRPTLREAIEQQRFERAGTALHGPRASHWPNTSLVDCGEDCFRGVGQDRKGAVRFQ